MSYVNGLDYEPRRPATQHLTGREAIDELNRLSVIANKKIAHWRGQAKHWENQLEIVLAENDHLTRQAARLEDELADLSKQLETALRKYAKKRKGKNELNHSRKESR